MDKTQSSKFCQLDVKRICFQYRKIKRKWLFDHSTTLISFLTRTTLIVHNNSKLFTKQSAGVVCCFLWSCSIKSFLAAGYYINSLLSTSQFFFTPTCRNEAASSHGIVHSVKAIYSLKYRSPETLRTTEKVANSQAKLFLDSRKITVV